MCGIAGIVTTGRLTTEDRVRAVAMRDVITHRGPDDAGLYLDDHAALGHRRLSIVDLAAGHQPLSNETNDLWIAFNGEIYNHAAVRAELERRPGRAGS
jgi:asparagine synthase (glutamine-hydrolysing)